MDKYIHIYIHIYVYIYLYIYTYICNVSIFLVILRHSLIHLSLCFILYASSFVNNYQQLSTYTCTITAKMYFILNVTSAVLRVRIYPQKWQSSHLQLYTLLHSRKLYTLNSFAKMFTVEDNIFQTLGYSSVTQNLNKKSVSDFYICKIK